MTNKDEREDAVLDAFLRHVQADSVTARLIEQPDRLLAAERTYPALTSDGLLHIEGPAGTRDWSCDVMTLAAPVTHGQIPRFLHEDLDSVATDHGLLLRVTGQVSTIRDLKALPIEVRRQVSSGARGPVTVAGGTVQWEPASPGRVVMAVGLPSPSSALTTQMIETLSDPLISKATKQAAPAKTAGIGAVVLVDGVGPPGML